VDAIPDIFATVLNVTGDLAAVVLVGAFAGAILTTGHQAVAADGDAVTVIGSLRWSTQTA
jgi:Na+/H+-dicarboxylate symporter